MASFDDDGRGARAYRHENILTPPKNYEHNTDPQPHRLRQSHGRASDSLLNQTWTDHQNLARSGRRRSFYSAERSRSCAALLSVLGAMAGSVHVGTSREK